VFPVVEMRRFSCLKRGALNVVTFGHQSVAFSLLFAVLLHHLSTQMNPPLSEQDVISIHVDTTVFFLPLSSSRITSDKKTEEKSRVKKDVRTMPKQSSLP
jgi:hypothetical protein